MNHCASIFEKLINRMVVRQVIARAGVLCYRSTKLINNFSFDIKYISTSSLRTARLYTDKHEWVELDGKIGTVGISHYAQESLGDVVFAQLPEVNTELSQKDECGALESVKAASELFSPVSGKVIEKNNAVEDTPSLINKSCYEKGWLFKVQISKTDELKDLMDENKYEEFLKNVDEH